MRPADSRPLRASDSVEPIRGRRQEGARRLDPPAGSRHSRLADDLQAPLDDDDPDRARLICATICRELLGDLSPALLLLSVRERARLQALTSHLRALFDFAAQGGLHGERLAQINRWEFELERALAGDPPGQPIFVAMALAHRETPWPRQALDAFTAAARRTVIGGRREHTEIAVAAAMCEAFLGPTVPPDLSTLVHRLLLALGLRQQSLAGQVGEGARKPQARSFARQLREFNPASIPREWRRCLSFLALVADRSAGGSGKALGFFDRLGLLARALVMS